MIFTISSANKISYFYEHIKKFAKRANGECIAGEIAHWLRTNVGNPFIKIIVFKKEDVIKGYSVFGISNEMDKPRVSILEIYSEDKDGTKEMMDYIVNYTKENGIDKINYATYHNPEDFLIKAGERMGYKFKKKATIMQMEVE